MTEVINSRGSRIWQAGEGAWDGNEPSICCCSKYRVPTWGHSIRVVRVHEPSWPPCGAVTGHEEED